MSKKPKKLKLHIKNKVQSVFVGTVDDLLKHCESIDADDATNENLDALNKDANIQYIMNHENVSREDAEKIYYEFQTRELDTVIDDLLEKGIYEIAEYDSEGQPKYGLTELGKAVANELLNKK